MFTNTREAIKAETDIVCYKKVCIEEVLGDLNAVCLRSMYYHFGYTPGKMYTCPAFMPVLHDEEDRAVRDGFYTYTEIIKALRTYGCESPDAMAVLKCVIPKDTLLYKSHIDDEYCSRCIEVVGWDKISTASLRYHRGEEIEWRTDLARVQGDELMPAYKEDCHDISLMREDCPLDNLGVYEKTKIVKENVFIRG